MGPTSLKNSGHSPNALAWRHVGAIPTPSMFPRFRHEVHGQDARGTARVWSGYLASQPSNPIIQG